MFPPLSGVSPEFVGLGDPITQALAEATAAPARVMISLSIGGLPIGQLLGVP
jgi:hypothetical protein